VQEARLKSSPNQQQSNAGKRQKRVACRARRSSLRASLSFRMLFFCGRAVQLKFNAASDRAPNSAARRLHHPVSPRASVAALSQRRRVRLPPQNSRTLLQRGGSSFATSQQRFSLASSLPKFQERSADDAKYFRPSSKRNERSFERARRTISGWRCRCPCCRRRPTCCRPTCCCDDACGHACVYACDHDGDCVLRSRSWCWWWWCCCWCSARRPACRSSAQKRGPKRFRVYFSLFDSPCDHDQSFVAMGTRRGRLSVRPRPRIFSLMPLVRATLVPFPVPA
jgi:hypothetical protein